MSLTAQVFQLPMFWLNADAEPNACRADPTPSTPQRTKPSAPTALQSTTMQQVVLHRTASLQHAPCNIHRYVDKTRARLSQEPNLTHICAWTRPHRRRDSPTSEVGHPHICAGDHLRRD